MANSGNGNGAGNGWQPTRAPGAGNTDEQRRIEDCARHDAYLTYQAIRRQELWISPDGELWPLAVEATYAYMARLRQESTAIPRWTRTTAAPLDTMREYWQWIGNRYSEAFHAALSYHVSLYTRTEGKVIPTAPPVASEQRQRQRREA